MKKRILFSVLLLAGCQEEPIEPTPTACECYQHHEALSSNLGTFTWINDYDTAPLPDLCDKDNGTWIYNANSTHRYKYICQ